MNATSESEPRWWQKTAQWVKREAPWAWQKALTGITRLILAIFGYSVLLFSLLTFLDIVSPTLAEEPAVVMFMAIVSAIAVIMPPFLVPVLLERLNTFPDHCLKTPHTEDDLAPMILNLRVRSRLFKVGAVTAFLLMAGATLLGFTVAQNSIVQSQGTIGDTTDTISGTAVTAIVLLLFLLRTLASIYRYNMRLAAFYDARADYLQAGGPTKGLEPEDLLHLFSTTELDTGWTERLVSALKQDSKTKKDQRGNGN